MHRGTVVMFGSYDSGLHPRVAVLRDGLRDLGWSVSELNVPLGASTADKVDAAGSPLAAVVLVLRMLRSWAGLVLGRLRRRARPDVVVVGYLGHLDVYLARLLYPRSTIVLDHLVSLADTVADRDVGSSPVRRVLSRVDDLALGAADLVVVDTRQQADELPARHRSKAVVVPVGAGEAWERARRAAGRGDASTDGASGPLRVVFFGLFTPLQGAVTIGEAAARLGDAVELTMVGHGQDRDAAREAAGGAPVHWVDWVEAEDLPDLVAAHDVCLGVFGTGPKTRRVVPTKVFQGLAAGCAVVTADTPAVREVLGDAVLTVPAGDAGALADALRLLADDRDRLADLRRRATTAAAAFAPAAAVEGLDARLTGDGPVGGPLPALTLNAWLRWDVIEREVRRSGARSVLEIGPGEGAVACRLAAGRTYTGVETSPRTRRMTADRLAGRGTPGTLVASLDDLPAGETFDLVCSFEVIEHIADDEAALAAWAARVRPGGRLVLSTPAGPARMGPHDVIAGHLRRYDAGELAEMARRCGLVDVRVVHVGFPAGYLLEMVRNRVAAHRLGGAAPGDTEVDELTEASSSIMQPPPWAGLATRLVSLPARLVQRVVPSAGTGLVLTAGAP